MSLPEASRPLQTAAKLPTPSRANRVGGTRPEEMVAARLRQSVEREAGAAAAAELPPPPRLVPSWLRDPGTSGPLLAPAVRGVLTELRGELSELRSRAAGSSRLLTPERSPGRPGASVGASRGVIEAATLCLERAISDWREVRLRLSSFLYSSHASVGCPSLRCMFAAERMNLASAGARTCASRKRPNAVLVSPCRLASKPRPLSSSARSLPANGPSIRLLSPDTTRSMVAYLPTRHRSAACEAVWAAGTSACTLFNPPPSQHFSPPAPASFPVPKKPSVDRPTELLGNFAALSKRPRHSRLRSAPCVVCWKCPHPSEEHKHYGQRSTTRPSVAGSCALGGTLHLSCTQLKPYCVTYQPCSAL